MHIHTLFTPIPLHNHHTTVLCPDLPDPENGQVLLSGSFATYQCDAGFFPTGGDVFRLCETNGEWSGSAPTCEGMLYILYHLAFCTRTSSRIALSILELLNLCES